MEEKAKTLWRIIDTICGGYHIYKDENVLEKAKKAAEPIQEYCSFFLQGNIFGMEEKAYQELYCFVVQTLEDFVEAITQEDTILMLDTLDYGLREIVYIYRENDEATA